MASRCLRKRKTLEKRNKKWIGSVELYLSSHLGETMDKDITPQQILETNKEQL